jgi:hypothetical protein
MFGSAILDVAIGLIFVFLLVSLMITALTELLAGWRKWRAKMLWNGLVNLLDDPGKTEWATALYAHPLIQGMSSPAKQAAVGPAGGKNGPSYIPSHTFALALLDILQGAAGRDLDAAPDQALVQTGIARLQGSRLGRVMAVLHEEAKGDVDKLKQVVARWFDDDMDRVSGWYKRHTQLVHVFLAVGLTLGIDVDAILIVQHLSSDPALRGAIVAEAQGFARQPAVGDPQLSALNQQLVALDLPVGWTLGAATPALPDPTHRTLASWADLWPAVRFHFWGWLLTAIAASLGAPFWFDMLNKVIAVRASGKAPGEPHPAQAPPATITLVAPPGPPASTTAGPG